MRLRKHPARIAAADVRPGDQVQLVDRWWPVEHVYRDADVVEIALTGADHPLTLPRTDPVTARWPVPARRRS